MLRNMQAHGSAASLIGVAGCHTPKNQPNMKSYLYITLLLFLFFGLAACGGSDSSSSTNDTANPSAETGGLSQAELENGIGPIKELALASTIDADLSAKGGSIYTTKCGACHKFDKRYVGPSLGDVMSNRTPAFVMNMMLNPEEMVQKHPVVKDLLAQFMTPMPNQNLTEEDARAVLEYIRDNQTEAAEATP